MTKTYRISVTPIAISNQPHAKLYFLRGKLSQQDAHRLTTMLLADPVSEIFEVSSLQPSYQHSYIEVSLLPGVTDSVAENLVNAAKRLGVQLEEAATVFVVSCFLFWKLDDYLLWFLLFSKLAVDFVLIHKTNCFLKTKTNSFFISSLFYPFFSVSVALYSLFGKYEWKGRRF